MDGTPILEHLPAHEARLLALSPDLLGAVGFDGSLRLFNPAWTITLGMSHEELAATPFVDIIHPDDREKTAGVVEQLRAGGRIDECVCRIRGADGGTRHLLWSAQGSPEDGCFYLAGKDITERTRLEEELAVRADGLERINAELQNFAYIASHDLSEPLRMITSYLELLQRRYGGQLDETADEFIEQAVHGASRMKALIDDLLEYSRVGTRELEPADVDLSMLVADVLRVLGRAIAEAGATVQPVEPLGTVCGDASQIGQLLQNLIANAVKFRDPERAPVVTVACIAQDGGVRVDVADNGIGIPVAQHERVFKMFARLHGRDEYAGTGIGLALCRRIAERHGGSIEIASEPGVGSTFSTLLPGSA